MNKLWLHYGTPPWMKEKLKKLKLTVFILAVSTLTSLASMHYANSKKLTVIKENSTVMEVLNAIQEQSEFKFFYSSDVQVDRKVSVNVKDKFVFEILDELFDGTNIKY